VNFYEFFLVLGSANLRDAGYTGVI
jgi:hypothetical protein